MSFARSNATANAKIVARVVLGRRAETTTTRTRTTRVAIRAKGKKDDEDDEIDPEEIELDAMERMEKTMDAIANDFSTVRTGRANAAILDRVEVDYYGAPTPLKTIVPISTTTLTAVPVTKRPPTTPIRASGTLKRMTKGWLMLSKVLAMMT